MNTQRTTVQILLLENGKLTREDKSRVDGRLSGWNHFDITRDDSGNSKIYLNGEIILEYSDALSITPQWFYFSTPEIGPVLDNLVVRNQVIDIKPQEKE